MVTGGESSLGSLEEKTRRIWAIARVFEETGGEKSPHKSELEEEAEQAEHEFNSTVVSLFNRVYYPSKGQLAPAKLAMTFAGNQFRAEDQIEKALSDVGTSKLYRTVADNAEMLIARAEEMLWPAGGERRVLWRDVVSRALTNERWPWLPPKGLDELRKIAEGSGRWKYFEEGYIEKGPFPKPRTRVLGHRARLQGRDGYRSSRNPGQRRRAPRTCALCQRTRCYRGQPHRAGHHL